MPTPLSYRTSIEMSSTSRARTWSDSSVSSANSDTQRSSVAGHHQHSRQRSKDSFHDDHRHDRDTHYDRRDVPANGHRDNHNERQGGREKDYFGERISTYDHPYNRSRGAPEPNYNGSAAKRPDYREHHDVDRVNNAARPPNGSPMLQRAVVPGGNLNNSPPSKVVRAIASYRAMKNGELSFNSGEFFYVINDSHPRFLDVINPQTKQRGIVPVDFFEILDRADRGPNVDERMRNLALASPSSRSPRPPNLDSPSLRNAAPPIAQSPRYNNHDDDRRYMNGGRDPAARDAVSPPRSGYPDIVPPSPSQRHLDDRYLRSPSPVKTAGDRSQFLQPPSSPPSNGGPVILTRKDSRNYRIRSPPSPNLRSPPPTSPLRGPGSPSPLPSPNQPFGADLRSPGAGDARGYLGPPSPRPREGSDPYVEGSHGFPRKDSGYSNSSGGETAVSPELFHSTPHDEAQYLNLVNGNGRLGFERKVDPPRGAAPATLGGRPPAPIVSVAIQAYERRQDGHYLFTLEVKREDQARSLLFRVYDDIYILHISLLTHFPSESGRSDSVSEPRIIPLLQPPVPSASLNPNSLRQLVSHLNVYFEELLHLPPHMLNSAPMKRFFVLRPAPAAINNGRADIETPLDEQMDVSATLIDMIHDYTDEGLIPIKVSFQNDNWVWKVFDSVGYQEFIEDIEKRLGMRRNAVRKVQYRDETGALVRLKGDLDLRILLRTSYSRLCFFVE